MAFWSKPWWGNVTAFIGNLLGVGRVPAEADETGNEEVLAELARQEARAGQQNTIIMVAVIGVGVLIGVFVLFGSKKKKK